MLSVDVIKAPDIRIGTIKLPQNATIKNVKEEVSKLDKSLPVYRQSIKIDLDQRGEKDEEIVSDLGLTDGSKIYVKDLGPQVRWKTVFILEYLGPIFFYCYLYARPVRIYGYLEEYEDDSDDNEVEEIKHSLATILAFVCWNFHFSKRLYETIYVHRFSNDTMPLRNLFKNCTYYWGFTFYVGYHLNHPLYTPPRLTVTFTGLFIFSICEYGNFQIHLLLKELRPLGTKVRKVPFPNDNPMTFLYNYVSCPNYTYEVGSWIGFTIMTSCLPVFIFATCGFYQMINWGIKKHFNYLKEFPDYPKKRRVIIPFIL